MLEQDEILDQALGRGALTKCVRMRVDEVELFNYLGWFQYLNFEIAKFKYRTQSKQTALSQAFMRPDSKIAVQPASRYRGIHEIKFSRM